VLVNNVKVEAEEFFSQSLVCGCNDCDATSQSSPVKQLKINQILAYVKYLEKEGRAIKQILETHKQEISKMRKETDVLGPKFYQSSEMVSEMMKDYSQIKQAIGECEVRYQELKINCDKGMKDKGKTI
jgi:uncharacterized coiled-coil DUF342 family protein